MKKFFRKTCVLFISGLLAISSFGIMGSGCGGSVADDEQTLQVYAWQAGFGIQWVLDTLDAFKDEPWVKEKYGDVNIESPVFNDNQNFTVDRVSAGEVNTIDLFFSESTQGLLGTKYILDLTELVYNREVPGEGILYKDKMYKSFYESCLFENKSGEKRNYYTPCWGGAGGIVYNATLFQSLGFDVPNTTDELVDICSKVRGFNGQKPGYPYTYSLTGSKIDYFYSYVSPIWWAQYEGVDEYYNYYNGIADGISNNVQVVYQNGRYEALKVMETLYSPNTGYYNQKSPNYEFMVGQSNLLMGQGLFMGNGNWFANEMREINQGYRDIGYDYEFGFMKTPVISAITDKTPSIVSTANNLNMTKDALLSAIIDEIDAGVEVSSYFDDGVTEEDYEFIRKARGVVYSLGANSMAIIPAYATGKDLAIDYLRFLATDKGISIYMKATGGANTVFNYNVKSLNSDEYKDYDKISKDVIDIFEYKDLQILPFPSNFPLVRYGGFNMLAPGLNGISTLFSTAAYTADSLFQAVVDYWTANGNEKWENALSLAGLA